MKIWGSPFDSYIFTRSFFPNECVRIFAWHITSLVERFVLNEAPCILSTVKNKWLMDLIATWIIQNSWYNQIQLLLLNSMSDHVHRPFDLVLLSFVGIGEGLLFFPVNSIVLIPSMVMTEDAPNKKSI